MITFTKLKDGSWGLRAHDEKIVPGQRITVAKKDGTKVPAVVGEIVWEGGFVILATIAPKESSTGEHQNSSASHTTPPSRNKCACTDPSCDCHRGRCRCSRECNCRGGNIYDC